GRCLDNVFVERLWRSVKYEDIYLWRYEAVPQLQQGLGRYFPYYNEERFHQSLDYRTPAAVYREERDQRPCIGKSETSGGRDDYRRDLHLPPAARPQLG